MRKLTLSILIIIIAVFVYSCSETAGPGCNTKLPATIAKLYDCGPDVDNCYEGKLKPDEGIKVWSKLKEIRSLHRLQEVSINPDDEVYAQEAALITCANEEMNHEPPNTSKCFTQNGYKGCVESNLWLGSATQVYDWLSEKMILDWLIDDKVESLGHRRWLLNPFMRNFAYGRVDKVSNSGRHVTAGVLKVFDQLVYWPRFESDIEYVAYPEGNYPADAFKLDWYLSFSAVADRDTFFNNKNVDFSNATIEMKDESDNPVIVNSISYNTEGYGIPNVIQWKAEGLVNGKRYTVSIKKVKYKELEKNYTYWFKIVTTL
ncbi:MAG: CAP domain-containing protein [Bacteroidetes bacterium]|nr:MAG: CAP domain-containing protein [Bacteroidota bacterium]